MNKHIFKLLFFIICLGVTNDILSMDPYGNYGRSGNYRYEPYYGREDIKPTADAARDELAECPVCYDDVEKKDLHTLDCRHTICKECLTSQLEVAYRADQLEQLRCPIPECKIEFTEQDYSRMKAFASNIIYTLQKKIEDNARPILPPDQDASIDEGTKAWIAEHTKICPQCYCSIEKSYGCDHMTCKRCRYDFCWLCSGPRPSYYGHQCLPQREQTRREERLAVEQARIREQTTLQEKKRAALQEKKRAALSKLTKRGASVAAIAGAAGYGLYKIYKYKYPNQTWFEEKLSAIKRNIQSKIAKAYSSLNSKSGIWTPLVVGTGLFIILNKKSVNLAGPFNACAAHILGDKYWRMAGFLDNNLLLGPIKNQFDNGRIINAGLSIAGGFTAGLATKYASKLLGGSTYKPKTTVKIIKNR